MSSLIGHGAWYYKKLETLAKRIKVFKPLPTHHAYVEQLHSVHGRKKVFGRDWNHDVPKSAAQHGVTLIYISGEYWQQFLSMVLFMVLPISRKKPFLSFIFNGLFIIEWE